MIERLARPAGSVLVAVAIAITIVAAAVLPFLNPAWVAFAQDRADATAWTGYSATELRIATDAILADLVSGPPNFDVAVGGEPVLNTRERGHLTDVRGVFVALAVLAAAAAAVLVLAVMRTRSGDEGRGRVWRAMRAGALGLMAAVGVIGVVGAVAFDRGFEVFHRLFFTGGTYTFDARTERLVQLFPQRFWFETSMALGLVVLVLAGVVAALATRRLRAPRPSPTAVPAPLETAR